MGKAAKGKAKKPPKKTRAAAAKHPSHSEAVLSRSWQILLPVAILILVVLFFWGNWLWRRVEPIVESSDAYRLDPHTIEVQPKPPEWIRGDIRTQVLRNAMLEESLSMLDKKLPQRIADAFEFHPWVASAKVTLQYPARVRVELTYRRPVAQLSIENRNSEEQVVLDPTGIRLPETDLTAKEIAALPVVAETVGIHLPLVGQRMEDLRTRGAVEIAALLAADWPELSLMKIVPLAVLQGEKNARYQAYELQGTSGGTYLWGAAPSEMPAEEVSSTIKIQRLKSALKLAREKPARSTQAIDLRNALPGEAEGK
jgi:hypothetical protein